MSDIVGRLRSGAAHQTLVTTGLVNQAADLIADLRAENERLRSALDLYRQAVRIDATMEGPKFMGSNASALKRAWDADLAAITLEEKQ